MINHFVSAGWRYVVLLSINVTDSLILFIDVPDILVLLIDVQDSLVLLMTGAI